MKMAQEKASSTSRGAETILKNHDQMIITPQPIKVI
jgi:hypothetical protein